MVGRAARGPGRRVDALRSGADRDRARHPPTGALLDRAATAGDPLGHGFARNQLDVAGRTPRPAAGSRQRHRQRAVGVVVGGDLKLRRAGGWPPGGEGDGQPAARAGRERSRAGFELTMKSPASAPVNDKPETASVRWPVLASVTVFGARPAWRPTRDRASAVAPPKRPINHLVTDRHHPQSRTQIRQGVHGARHPRRSLTTRTSSDKQSPSRCALSAQREAVASGDEALVGAAKEVSAGAVGHQRSRIVTAVQQPWIRRGLRFDAIASPARCCSNRMTSG